MRRSIKTDWNNWLSWWRPLPVEYIDAKRELRIARLVAAAIYVPNAPTWSAWRKHQCHMKALANARVRRCQRRVDELRRRHQIPVVHAWKPVGKCLRLTKARRLFPEKATPAFTV
jgi:hypothetical protein